jgi:hypothetical protein
MESRSLFRNQLPVLPGVGAKSHAKRDEYFLATDRYRHLLVITSSVSVEEVLRSNERGSRIDVREERETRHLGHGAWRGSV